jgi:hypothetical protein
VEDGVDVRRTVAATGQDTFEAVEIGIDLEVPRRLLVAEAAVEVCAEGGVPRVAG